MKNKKRFKEGDVVVFKDKSEVGSYRWWHNNLGGIKAKVIKYLSFHPSEECYSFSLMLMDNSGITISMFEDEVLSLDSTTSSASLIGGLKESKENNYTFKKPEYVCDLPNEIQDLYKTRQAEAANTIDVNISVGSDSCVGGFNWRDTPEGFEFWWDILSKGKYRVFYEKYPNLKTKNKIDNTNSISKNNVICSINETKNQYDNIINITSNKKDKKKKIEFINQIELITIKQHKK